MDNVSFGYFIVKPDGAKNIDNILKKKEINLNILFLII